MSALLRWEAPSTYSAANLADATAMASRANGYKAIAQVGAVDVAIDNATNKHKYLTIEALIASWTPAVTDYLELYLLYAYDGSTYESGSSSFLPPADRLWRRIMFSTDTSAAAKRFGVTGPILPFKAKVLWRWMGTNSTPGSGCALSFQTFGDNLNG